MGEHDEKTGEKVGVYICHCGGNISEHVDVEALAGRVREIPGVAVAHTNMFMCSDPGQELIQKDIADGVVDRVVVASCAPSLHELTFRSAVRRAGMNPFLYEHANIREQVSWVHHGESATEKAALLVAAAVAKARELSSLEPIRVDAKNHATVIGGGMAGMRAALDLALRGVEVVLVEKTPFLGGYAARLGRVAPYGERAVDLVQELADRVAAEPGVTVLTCAEVTAVDGYVGNFTVTVRRRLPDAAETAPLAAADLGEANPFVPSRGVLPGAAAPETENHLSLRTGAIVLATGFLPYRPKAGEFGYGDRPEVVTLPELVEALAASPSGARHLTVGGRTIRRVAFVHCVGSRQIPGIDEPDADGRLNEYCSRTCCAATLQAAAEIRERHPGTRVMSLYRDIRTYGRGQEALYERASRDQVTFFRYEAEHPPEVAADGRSGFPVSVTVRDTLTFGEELAVPVDLVVLATGMAPNPIPGLVEEMKLPVGAEGFLQEVHPKLRPVEVATTGILLAGTCQAPMDIGEACAAAQAASAKAASILARGFVELDPFVASVDPERCTGAGACAAACPVEGAIGLEEAPGGGRRARVVPALCTGCGICVAECPENAVDVNGWTLEQYEAMVDAIVAA
jgi:heterodisulfide reductase subunit A